MLYCGMEMENGTGVIDMEVTDKYKDEVFGQAICSAIYGSSKPQLKPRCHRSDAFPVWMACDVSQGRCCCPLHWGMVGQPTLQWLALAAGHL